MRLDIHTTIHNDTYQKLDTLGFENSSDSRDMSAHLTDGRLDIWVIQDLPENREKELVDSEKYTLCINPDFDQKGDSLEPLAISNYIDDIIEKIDDYYFDLRNSHFQEYRDNLIKEISNHPNILGDADGSIYYESSSESHYTFCYCTPLWECDDFIDELWLCFYDRDGNDGKQVKLKYELTKDIKKDTENFFKLLYKEL